VCEVQVSPHASESLDLAISSSSQNVRVPAGVRTRVGQSRTRFIVTAAPTAGGETAVVEVRIGSETVRDNLVLLGAGSPLLSVPGTQTAKPGDAVHFSVTATGDQNLPAAISVRGLPANATFSPTTGDFEWLPAQEDLGSRDILFTAINSTGAEVSKAVTVTVADGRPILDRLQNFAGTTALAACSPNSAAALLGSFLSAGNPAVDLTGGTKNLGGTRVQINGDYAAVLRSAPDRVDFVCPNLPQGTPLQIVVETATGVSGLIQSTMAESAPGILTADGSGTGQALAVHPGSTELAAIPNFRMSGKPAIPGDSLTVLATGIDCSSNSASRQPHLRVGADQAQIISVTESPRFAGVCEIGFVVPAGVFGDGVSLTVDVLRGDGKIASSNTTSISVDLR
jgi:uncharacterized protein (TIGR03437 family)